MVSAQGDNMSMVLIGFGIAFFAVMAFAPLFIEGGRDE